MKTFKFSLVLRSLENTDVFITLEENIYGVHSKKNKYPLCTVDSRYLEVQGTI